MFAAGFMVALSFLGCRKDELKPEGELVLDGFGGGMLGGAEGTYTVDGNKVVFLVGGTEERTLLSPMYIRARVHPGSPRGRTLSFPYLRTRRDLPACSTGYILQAARINMWTSKA